MAKHWLRNRGYIHLIPQLNVLRDSKKIHAYIKDSEKIAVHNFSPLLYKQLRERRYKKINQEGNSQRKHSWVDGKGNVQLSAKDRPIHYATHIDSAIYSYYAIEKLGKLHEGALRENQELSNCVTAYRRTKKGEKGKNNVDYAKDVFDFIKQKKDCVAIAMDIKSFFSSLNHKVLKKAWCKLLGETSLPPDHYNLFKSITNFSYVNLDDFRVGNAGFDEYQLHLNRRKGAKSFFASRRQFYEAIKTGKVSIKKNQRRSGGCKIENKHTGKLEKRKCGIPQGLAISSVLANLYLLDFDKAILEKVLGIGGMYRRYSDDIVIVCDQNQLEDIITTVNDEIALLSLKISKEKTEICQFASYSNSGFLTAQNLHHKKPHHVTNIRGKFTYLGFSYDGRKVLIKDKNISRFYRRMKQAVKRKVKRAESQRKKTLSDHPDLYYGQLARSFTKRGATTRKIEVKTSHLRFDRSTKEWYKYQKSFPRKQRGNFHAYVRMASRIMNETAITSQLRNCEQILDRSIARQMKKQCGND